jgi:hypothetical protein
MFCLLRLFETVARSRYRCFWLAAVSARSGNLKWVESCKKGAVSQHLLSKNSAPEM